MLIIGLDLETSSIDPTQGKILEIAYVLKRVGEPRAWKMRTEFIYDPSWGDDFIPKEAQLVNGIHPDHVKRFGIALSSVAREINHIIRAHKVDAIVGHNIRAFDIPYLMHHIGGLSTDHWSEIKTCPVIDTMTDIDYPTQIKTRNLVHLAAEHGFLNFQAHSALADVITTLRLLECYDVKDVLTNAREPSNIYRVMCDYDTREKAKSIGARWQEIDGRKFPNCWVIRLRDSQVEPLVARIGVPIKKIG